MGKLSYVTCTLKESGASISKFAGIAPSSRSRSRSKTFRLHQIGAAAPLGSAAAWVWNVFPLPPCLFALHAPEAGQHHPSLYPPGSWHFVVLLERVAHWADSLRGVATLVSCTESQKECCPVRVALASQVESS
eukprot:987484-Pelagomonas_calceolata.AAC.1